MAEKSTRSTPSSRREKRARERGVPAAKEGEETPSPLSFDFLKRRPKARHRGRRRK